MSRAAWWGSVAALALTSMGCAPVDDVDAQTSNHTECVAAPAVLEFVEDEDQSNLTALRVQSLNDYAEQALASRQCDLETALEHREVDVHQTTALADAYRITVGNEATCLNGGWLGNRDLEQDRRYRDMKTQVDNVAEFLKTLHEDTHGVPTALFDTVTICPRTFNGNKMELVGPTLYLNVAFGALSGIWTWDARELRADLWTKGKQFDVFENSDGIKKLWPLLDPGGTVRYSLRQGIARRALGLLGRLVGLDGTEIAEMRAELQQLALENASDVSTEDAPSLRARAQVFFEEATPEQLRCVASHWQDDLNDPESWTDASGATLATLHKSAARNAHNVKVSQYGAIAIGNTHIINVNLDIFLGGGYQRFERYIEVEQVEQNIEWTQYALLAIYTVDGIDVNLSVSAINALQSASLDTALSRCGG